MSIRTASHKKYITKNEEGQANGFLVPLYNIHEQFFQPGKDRNRFTLQLYYPDW